MAGRGDVAVASSGDSGLDEKISEWLSLDQHPDSIAEVNQLIKEMKFEELRAIMMSPLSFGTAGLRSKMGAGFSRINDLTIIQATQGLCKYLEKLFPDLKERGVVVGYDARNNSKRFAQRTGNVFASQGVPVYLFSKITPTPFVPYCVRRYKCICGVMVTASHNPKDDNGYKVYLDNGAQIKSPHDKGISQCIKENKLPWQNSWILDDRNPLIKDPYNRICSLYFEDIKQYSFYRDTNSKTSLKCVFTPMHGVGQRFVELAFEAFNLPPFTSVAEQMVPDPNFPTVRYPNPEEGKTALHLAMKTADENSCNVILANDPDSDRMALAEKQPSGQWKVFTGNEIGILFGWWAFTHHKKQHPELYPGSSVYMIASTVSTKMLQSMAREEGFVFKETLTGFKWMGNLAFDLMAQGKTVLFSFEEAIGFMFGTMVLDKDGISAAVVMAEMASHLRSRGLTLTQQLNSLYNRYGIHVSNNSYYLCYSTSTIKSIFDRIRTLQDGQYPSACGPYKLSAIRDLTVGYDSTEPDCKPVLPVNNSSQMITFYFENGCVATLRTSGTEPKIKYYTELSCKPGERDIPSANKILQDVVNNIVEEYLQPHVNHLIPKED
ncbi:PREDICTED: phosphoglucomutase-2-like [Acropora digitifera]|uniref:phosphoglucomutase-2-like n=1 Tax=Acropora digitifera TaxID=70779 RepID=UPI00077B16D1|nr:PREDICTED: phosphoglucomutase-2-like [Acropora digitifera]